MDLSLWFFILLINTIYAEDEEALTCFPGLKTPGYTIPSGDVHIAYGDSLDITCTLHSKYAKTIGGNASRYMTFKRKSELIPHEMIEYINSRSIKLHIDKPPKVSQDEYSCYYLNESICMNFVWVGVKPQNISDFKCIGYDYDNLTCAWSEPQNYVKTNYSLTFRIRNRSGQSYPCPEIINDNGKLSCTWTPFTTPLYRQVQETFYFTVTMKNTFGENSNTFLFNHFANVIPAAPVNLTLRSRTPSSLFFTWNISLPMQSFPPGVHSRIMYQCTHSGKKWKFGDYVYDKSFQYNLTGLPHPHELCDIRVALRSAVARADDESMWSKNASLNEFTASAPPQRPPLTNVGSFYLDTATHSLSQNNFNVMWQQIREEEQNGEGFKYKVEVEGHEPIYSLNSLATFYNLSNSKTHTFKIWSMNNINTSREYSTITIPQQRISEPMGFIKVEFENGTYELSWEPPKVNLSEVIDYTIFWCKSYRDRPYQCSGQLNWTQVDNSLRSYRVTLLNGTVYQFAISANTNKGSSGMIWATCTIIHNQNIGKMKNVWINRLGSTFIEVGWKLECSDRIGGINGFIIYYCPIRSPLQTECRGPERNATFKGSRLVSGTVHGLTPYTTYKLTVAMNMQHGMYSHQSDPLFNTTFEAAPSSPPLNLTVLNVTNSSIALAWDAPTAMNGVLKNYVLEFNNESRNVEHTNYTWDKLESFTTYDITVKACTISCSNKSKTLKITTLMDYPSKIDQPKAAFQNSTIVEVVWSRPDKPGGRNDYYEVQLTEKFDGENRTSLLNLTQRRTWLKNCVDMKSNAFFVSVRAVNIIGTKIYKGPWSDELQYFCPSQTYLFYIVAAVVIVFFVCIAIAFNKLYKYCKVMRDVEVKLPPGLAPVMTDTRLDGHHHIRGVDRDRDSPSPAADEELLLVKLNENRQMSGDSSGCSSGHESVTSSLESGTHISSSSDSGTEQTGGGGGGANDGGASGLGDGVASTFCISNSSTKSEPTYVPVGTDNNKLSSTSSSSYVISSQPTSPYVLASSEPMKSLNPGYIAFEQNTEPAGKSATGYVVAGIKNGYIPFNHHETVNRNTGYVVAGIKNCKLE